MLQLPHLRVFDRLLPHFLVASVFQLLVRLLVHYFNLTCYLHQIFDVFHRCVHFSVSQRQKRLRPLLDLFMFVQIVANAQVDELHGVSLFTLLNYELLCEQNLHKLPLQVDLVAHQLVFLGLYFFLSGFKSFLQHCLDLFSD